MDIKTEITNIVKKITEDKDLLAKFKTDPKGAVTALVSEAAGNETINAIIEGVKAKIDLDKAGKMVEGLVGDKANGLVDSVKEKLTSEEAEKAVDKAKDFVGNLFKKD